MYLKLLVERQPLSEINRLDVYVCVRVYRVVFKTRPSHLSPTQVTSEYGKDVHA